MLDIFRGLKNLVKVCHISIDSTVFKLHYSFTVMALLAFSLIVTTRQYVGNPIDCVHTKDVPEDVANTYCWIHSTFTIRSAFNKTVGVQVAHPGVQKAPDKLDPNDTKEVAYYQWVCFCLFIQAVMFYVPRWLWKNWEAGKIQAVMMDLDISIYPDVERKQKKKLLLDYLQENLEHHNWWTYRYFFCEFLALVNVVGQMFLMDTFFDGEFMTFGLDVIVFAQRDQEDRVDPMRFIFPRMTKCRFHKYGSSGDLERHDILCILPLNVVNEKIYIFLWFWFLVLFALTALLVLYRAAILASPRIRAYLLRIRFRLVHRDVVHTLVANTKVGDWYLFYMLGVNIDTVVFKEVMHELAKRLGHPTKEIEA